MLIYIIFLLNECRSPFWGICVKRRDEITQASFAPVAHVPFVFGCIRSDRRESGILFLSHVAELICFCLRRVCVQLARLVVGEEFTSPMAIGRRLRRHVRAPSMMFLKRKGWREVRLIEQGVVFCRGHVRVVEDGGGYDGCCAVL